MAENKSDLSRAFSEDGACKTHVGGQALLEGIMMRGKLNWAVAVREPDGNIYLEEHDLASGKEKRAWMRWPFVRGCTALIESLGLGFKALEIAAEHAFEDEEDENPAKSGKLRKSKAEADILATAYEDEFDPDPVGVKELAEAAQIAESIDAAVSESSNDLKGTASDKSASKDKKESGMDGVMTVSMILGVVLGIVLFIVAPAAITNLIVGEYDSNPVVWNIVDGVLRVAVFVFYIWLIGRMEDMKRMFMYHGAEHKTIHCYEHGLPLTPENARNFPRLHVRCGTAFLIMVLIIAIVVYTVIPLNLLIGALGVPEGLPKLALVIAVRIIFLPVIAGVSYEITVKWAGAHPENALVKVILWPGMQMQYLTTNEPDDDQIECAIEAMKLVLEREAAETANVRA